MKCSLLLVKHSNRTYLVGHKQCMKSTIHLERHGEEGWSIYDIYYYLDLKKSSFIQCYSAWIWIMRGQILVINVVFDM